MNIHFLSMAVMVSLLVGVCVAVLLDIGAKIGSEFEEWRQIRIKARRRARAMSWLHQFEARQRGKQS